MRSSPPDSASTSSNASEGSSSYSFGLEPCSEKTFAPDQDDVQTYESIMSSLLGEYAHRMQGQIRDDDDDEGISDGEGGKRPMTKAEKQNAKKKRRKERERAEKLRANPNSAGNGESEGIRSEGGTKMYKFRLFSSTPIGQIAIKPTNEEYPLTTNPRLDPLSDETNERIKRTAHQAAVEYNDLNSITTSNHEEWTKRQVPIKQYVSSYPISQSHLAICSTSDLYPTSISRKIPIISMRSPSTTKESKTRRGKRRKLTHVIPSYYAPLVGLGGKARGYAWGWEGSMEGAREL